MPIYEFHCQQCGRDSEVLVRSSDWEGTRCPKCESPKLTKKLSVFSAAGGGESDPGPACSGNPSACGRCGDF
ncbi:MAG: zinc ribbon domain-containing protein [Verrucomicrobia bacterium]|nr:zinc ribbon domain-containing protein [Verrucomicrobiota bacterium]